MEGYNRGHEKALVFDLRFGIDWVFQIFDTYSHLYNGGRQSHSRKDRGNQYTNPYVGAL